MTATEDRVVTVCAACLRASCWHGEFYCERAVGAGIRRMRVSELDALGKEHPSNYSVEKIAHVEGRIR